MSETTSTPSFYKDWLATRDHLFEDHDPLCVWRDAPWRGGCLGCVLVDLRSEATYAEGEDRKLAIYALREVVGVAMAHLEDAVNEYEEAWLTVADGTAQIASSKCDIWENFPRFGG